MITDEQIERYLYPYTQRQAELSAYVIRTIVKRVHDIGKLASFDDLYTIQETVRTSEDVQHMNVAVVKSREKQIRHLRDDLWDIAVLIYLESQEYYARKIALDNNYEALRAVQRSVDDAIKSLNELLRNPVIVMRDLKNPGLLKAFTLDEAYKSVINEASMIRKLNIDTTIALKRTTAQLADSGLRYMSDFTSNDLEAVKSANIAVRMNVLNSIKNIIANVDEVISKQIGADGVELSAHMFPAPDHAPAQGRQYTKAEFEKMQNGEDFVDVDGVQFEGFERQIGQWNCRHYVKSIKLGSKPTYTKKQLDKILTDNERGYTTPDGKHLTLYECTQMQRRYEREIRKAKERYLMCKDLGDTTGMSSSRTRVGKLTSQYKLFSQACDIPAKLERLTVKDYQ